MKHYLPVGLSARLLLSSGTSAKEEFKEGKMEAIGKYEPPPKAAGDYQ